MIDEDAIRQRWDAVGSKLDERVRRLFAAIEMRTAGRGGLAAVSKITGLARSTINRGEDDLDAGPLPKRTARRPGGGRRAVRDKDPGLIPALKSLVEPATLGDPMRPLLWVSKSPDKLAAALTKMGHPISADTVDKEVVGNYKNGGSDYRPKGNPCRVNAHDFEDKKLGKVAPYGVYDVTANTGFVSVGITSDTAEFAVQSIRCWRERMGLMRYPGAQELTVTADCGGSNGARVRLWKRELQNFADETGIAIHVHHYPPGTSRRVGRRNCTCGLSQNGA